MLAIVLLAVVVVWFSVMAVMLGVCASAAAGDRALARRTTAARNERARRLRTA